MINSMIAAISIALNNEFGNTYKTHMEEIKQDLEEPCFFIQCLDPDSNKFLKNRYFRKNSFCIQYFPESEEIQSECNETAERMLNCLEYIKIPGEDKPIMGTKMKYRVIDGVLNFFVNYDGFFYKKEEQSTTMESLQTSTSVKEGM